MEANVKPSYRFSPVSLTEIHEAHQTSTRDIVFRGTSKPRTQSVPPWFHHIFCPWLRPTPFKKGMLRWEQNGFHRFRFVLVHSYKQVLCKSHKFSNPNIGKTSRNACFAASAVAMQRSTTSGGQSLHNKFFYHIWCFQQPWDLRVLSNTNPFSGDVSTNSGAHP